MKASQKRGPKLEFLVSAVLQGEGFLVRRSLPIRFGSERQDVTDVDVIGFKFTRPFQLQTVICDCKDKKSPKAFERIFWAKGLGEFIGADEVYVAIPKTNVTAVNFGASGRVRVLSSAILNELFSKSSGKSGGAYGLVNPEKGPILSKRIDDTVRTDKYLSKAKFEIENLYFNSNPYVCTNQAHALLSEFAPKMNASQDSSDLLFAFRYFSAELVILFTLCLLKIASDTLAMNASDRRQYIYERLTYGSIPPEKAREIFRLAKELAVESVKSILRDQDKQTSLAFESQEIEAPLYAPDVVGLVERIIANPELYHNLPQVFDFLFYEQDFSTENVEEDYFRRTFQLGDVEFQLKAARNILSFVRDSTGLKVSRFWTKSAAETAKTT